MRGNESTGRSGSDNLQLLYDVVVSVTRHALAEVRALPTQTRHVVKFIEVTFKSVKG